MASHPTRRARGHVQAVAALAVPAGPAAPAPHLLAAFLWLLPVAAAVLLLASLGALPAEAGTGTYMGNVTLTQDCASGFGMGVAFDGRYLWVTCASSSPDLMKADPRTGQVLERFTVLGGLGAIAYDAGRNALWAGDGMATGGEVHLVRLDGTPQNNPIDWGMRFQGIPCTLVDGLAYDPVNDTLYEGCDDSTQVTVFAASTGQLLTTFNATTGRCHRSGLAISGDTLYQAAAACGHIWATSLRGMAPRFNFTTFTPSDHLARDEGLACDHITFAPKHVLWSREAFNPARVRAFEVPTGTCLVPTGPHLRGAAGEGGVVEDCKWGTSGRASPWPMARGGAAHSGHVDDGVPLHEVPWQALLNPGSAHPVVGACRVLQGSGAMLRAYDAATGRVLWAETLDAEVVGSPGFGEGVAIVATATGRLHALAQDTGREVWTHVAPAAVTSPVVAHGTVYVGCLDGRVYALDETTGTVRWQHNTGGPITVAPALAGGLLVVATTFQDGILLLDAANGNPMQAATPAPMPIRSDLTVLDGALYASAGLGPNATAVLALTLDGRPLWHAELPAPVGAPTIANGTVLVGAGDRALHALFAGNGTGRWRFNAQGRIAFPPAAQAGVAYVGDDEGVLYALNITDAQVKWVARLRGALSAPAVAGPLVFVASDAGFLDALNRTSGAQPWTPGPPLPSPTPSSPSGTTTQASSSTTTSAAPTASATSSQAAAANATSAPPRDDAATGPWWWLLLLPLVAGVAFLVVRRRR